MYAPIMGAPVRADQAEEILVPFPATRDRIPSASDVRNTLIASSQRALRERGRFEDYMRVLKEPWRELNFAVAGVWLPLEAALAHYRACDALGFTVAEQHEMGHDVGVRIHGTFLGTLIRGAKNAGVTPWIPLAHAHKLYDRLFNGGAVSVIRAGPKDARMEMVGNPCVGIPYFRNGLRSLWQVALEFFCTRAYVTETGHTNDSLRVRVSWA